MDMDGEIVHRWLYPEENPKPWQCWICGIPLADGDIIVVHKMKSVMRLDWNSNLVWEKKLVVHHDVAMAADISLYVFTFGVRPHT